MNEPTIISIDENLVSNLEEELSTFRTIKKQGGSKNDLLNNFYSLAEAMDKVIDARQKAMDVGITKEESVKLRMIPDYRITINLDYNVENLLAEVCNEILNFAKQLH